MKFTLFSILVIGLFFIPSDVNQYEFQTSQSALVPADKVIFNSNSNIPETEKFDKEIEEFMKRWNIRGASFAMMKGDRLVYSKGYGYADEDAEVSTDVRHLFRIASISKLITATGIMKLKEEGRLNLTDTIFGKNGILNDTLFQDINDKRITKITVEHLLRHQGGFSTAAGDPMFQPLVIAERMEVNAPADLTTTIQYILRQRLRYAPGQHTRYSNAGYAILSAVIEKVSGMEYETYIQKNILSPAGCFNMHIGRSFYDEKFPNEVRYYDNSSDSLVFACNGSGDLVPKYYGGNNIEGLQGAGGWIASPTELLRFLAVIDNDPAVPDILQPQTIALMTEYNPTQLPIGWMHTTENGEWVRSGTLCGTSALMKRQKDGTAWVFVTNTSSWKGSKFTKYINGSVSRAINDVHEWPKTDLFSLQEIDSSIPESSSDIVDDII